MIEVDTELESPGSEQRVPKAVEATYLDGNELFLDYIAARRTNDYVTVNAIEALMGRTEADGGPANFYVRVSSEMAKAYWDEVRNAKKTQAAARLTSALDNPENVDPRELGRILRDYLRLYDGDAEAAGEALHKGY